MTKRCDAPCKDNRLKQWQKRQWCLGEVGADFLWRMEDIFDLYAEPDDPLHPVVCLDECPYQLLDDVIAPLPPRRGRAARYHYEYTCGGTERPLRPLLSSTWLAARDHLGPSRQTGLRPGDPLPP